MIELVIYGQPRGKDRHRTNMRTGVQYTTKQTRLAETRIIDEWRNVDCPRLPDGPLWMTLRIIVARPKGHYKADGSLSAAGLREPHPRKKPDVDNALKLVMDSLNRCAYRDDVDIVHSWQLREWAARDEPERVIVKVGPMPTLHEAA